MRFNLECDQLINENIDSLKMQEKLFGGVFISSSDDGEISVNGADNIDLKIIFKTQALSEKDLGSNNFDEVVGDRKTSISGKLEQEGITVLSEAEFKKNMESINE